MKLKLGETIWHQIKSDPEFVACDDLKVFRTQFLDDLLKMGAVEVKEDELDTPQVEKVDAIGRKEDELVKEEKCGCIVLGGKKYQNAGCVKHGFKPFNNQVKEDELVIPEKIKAVETLEDMGNGFGRTVKKYRIEDVVKIQNQIIDCLSVIKEKMRV